VLVILANPQWPLVKLHLDKIAAAVSARTPGSYTEIESIRQTNYRVDRSGGWRYCRAAAQAAGVSPASR
jgi:Ser/Thr protein kinase RdoA (MazF antagonist)